MTYIYCLSVIEYFDDVFTINTQVTTFYQHTENFVEVCTFHVVHGISYTDIIRHM